MVDEPEPSPGLFQEPPPAPLQVQRIGPGSAAPLPPEPAPRRRPWRTRPHFGLAVTVVICLVFAAVLVVGSAVSQPKQVAVGDCVLDTASRPVPCGDPGPKFVVLKRIEGTADFDRCAPAMTDAAMVTAGPAILCIDYQLAVGDCVDMVEVAIPECGDPGEILQVTQVLTNSVDPTDCGEAAEDFLVHPNSREVLCLGPVK